MKKYLLVGGLVAGLSLVATSVLWACCSYGTVPISIYNITVTPNPATCPPVEISFTIQVGDKDYSTYAPTTMTVYVGGEAIYTNYYGMGGTYDERVSWTPSKPGTYILRIDASSIYGAISQPGPDIVVKAGGSVAITKAKLVKQGSLLFVAATSECPEDQLVVTIPGCVTQAPMMYKYFARLGFARYIYSTTSCPSSAGQTATVTSLITGAEASATVQEIYKASLAIEDLVR